jgi:adenylate cyclase
MVILSVIVDIALLLLLIWSFHIQYKQPAAFYLKAPTLLYVFIFIALRALRFEAKYVLVAGFAAAFGWAFLLWYAIAGEMNPLNMVTRDYVLYITSNRILVGAEIDKIVSIVLVTLVLAIAVTRAQRTLYRSVLEGTAARDLSKFVSPEIANRIVSADKAIQAGDGELRTATVMFTDIEGFSSLSEKMSPQELAMTLNEYFGALCEVVERNNGVVTMFQGDAMLIAYNTVTPDPNHAVSALRTALDIQDAVNGRTFGNGGVRLKTRCGINTGEIVTGAVGAKDRLVFTVHGDEVNVAARLEQLNKQYGTYVLCSGRTKAEAGGLFRYQRIGEVTVRGRAAPTEVYAVR